MWIQVKNAQGEGENRIAAEGTMAQAHLERLTGIHGKARVRPSPSTAVRGAITPRLPGISGTEGVRPSPSTSVGQAFTCGCQRTSIGGVSLCPGHGAEFSRRR